MNRYVLKWSGRAFGEILNVSLLVHILRDAGVEAVFAHNNYKDIIDCEFFDLTKHKNYKLVKFNGSGRTEAKSIIQFFRDKFYDKSGIWIDLATKRNHIPVKYYDIEDIKSFDVSLGTITGRFTPYRNWPYFAELKKILSDNGISYFDLKGTRGIETLNYVNKSKLYVGLETGTSHYVSQVASGKALIIQSGYTTFDFWATLYKYEPIQIDIECRPCFLRGECEHNHKCMKDVRAEYVAEKIMGRL